MVIFPCSAQLCLWYTKHLVYFQVMGGEFIASGLLLSGSAPAIVIGEAESIYVVG
jgi:hypothetical protein